MHAHMRTQTHTEIKQPCKKKSSPEEPDHKKDLCKTESSEILKNRGFQEYLQLLRILWRITGKTFGSISD